MCIFSGKVEKVANTNTFGRLDCDEQILIYSMELRSKQDVAMILPLPVIEQVDNAISFIDLKNYPQLFEDLRSVCAPSKKFTYSRKLLMKSSGPILKLHEVGNFIASFVPSLKDFDRLDPQFKLPDGTWDNLPQYINYGFAVFQLKKTAGADMWATSTIHPMGFRFKTALENKVFFPTIHIHEGMVKEREMFDHILYVQSSTSIVEAAPIDRTRHPEWTMGRFSDHPNKIFPESIFDLKADNVWAAKYQQIFDNKDVVVRVG